MNQSVIKWRKEDSIALQRAINSFNRNVRKLRRQEGKTDYLPDTVTYNELRDNIISRKELNRVITSLRNFSKKGAADLYETTSGEHITKWEYQEIKKARTRAIKTLNLERMKIEQGFKSSLMGDKRIREIESTIKNLNNLETASGYEFERIKKRAEVLGQADIELKRAMTYRQNYLNALEQMSGYENYDKLLSELNKIKNPIKFYEYIQKSNVLSDLFIYYKDKATSQTYGGFADNQDAFNYALNVELEIDLNE